MRKSLSMKFALLAVCAMAMAGCRNHVIVQRNVFADDDGEIVTVSYGRSESDHVNTFVSPVTGKEMEFKSNLLVVVTLPDGDDFKAWRCMNLQSMGTMYGTDNGRWKVLLSGFSCVIYRRAEDDDAERYETVYAGVLCDIDDSVKVEKNEKWKPVLKNGKEYRKPAPVAK